MARPAYTYDKNATTWVPFSGPEGKPGPSMTILGSVATVSNLPAAGANGDAWIVQDTGDLHVWDVTSGAWRNAGKVKGDKGDAGETLKISGAVATPADLPASPAPLTVYISQDNSALYIYDPASTGAGVNAPTGYVNLGKIAGPKGDDGLTGAVGPAGANAVIRSSVSETTDLPATGAAGDMRVVEKTGHLWSWDAVGATWIDGGKIRVDGKAAFFGPAVADLASLPSPGSPGEARITEDTMKVYSWHSDTNTWEEAGVLKSVPDGSVDGQMLVWNAGAWVAVPGIPKGTNNGDVMSWDANQLKWTANKSHLGLEDNVTITPTDSDGGTLVYKEATDDWDVRKIKVSELADGPGAVAPANGDVLGFSTAQQKWVPTSVNNLVLPWTARTYLTGSLVYHKNDTWRAMYDAIATDEPGDLGSQLALPLDAANKRDRVGAVSVTGTNGVEDADWGNSMRNTFKVGDYWFFEDSGVTYPYTVKQGPFMGYVLEKNAKIVWTGEPHAGVLGWLVVHPAEWDESSPTAINLSSNPVWRIVGPNSLDEIPDVDASAAKSDYLLVYDGTTWTATPSEFAKRADVNLRMEQFAKGIAHTTSVVAITNTPPSAPSGLTFFIVGTSPTGDWVGHANDVAYWSVTSTGTYGWHFNSPRLDETHLVEDEAKLYTFDGAKWVAATVSTGTGIPDGSTDGELLVWKQSLSRWEPELPQAAASTAAGAVVGSIVSSTLTENQFITATGKDSANWRMCDGRSAVGTTYATLTGRANVPDLRGAYFRMAGNNSTNPAWKGGNLLEWQEDATRMPHNKFHTSTSGNHRHTLSKMQGGNAGEWASTNFASGNGNKEWPTTDVDGNHSHNVYGGDTETRPKTFNVNYFLRVN
jgi:hypothetical protein